MKPYYITQGLESRNCLQPRIHMIEGMLFSTLNIRAVHQIAQAIHCTFSCA